MTEELAFMKENTETIRRGNVIIEHFFDELEDEGTRFAFREMTPQEIENRNLKAQLRAAEQSVAELTIIFSSLMA